MAHYKDVYNEAYYEAEERALELGLTAAQARDYGERLADQALGQYVESAYEAADNLRKARREQS